jgi:chromosome segregation ATPase
MNLLANASIDVQNFLLLEEKISLLSAELATSEQKLTQLANELKNQSNLSTQEIKVKEKSVTKLEKKIGADKDKIFNLNNQIQELNLYHQREIKKAKEDYQKKLTILQQQIKDLKEKSVLTISEKDKQLKVRQAEIISIKSEFKQSENSYQQSLKILEQDLSQIKQELSFTTGKITACEKIFVNQIIKIIKKNIII